MYTIEKVEGSYKKFESYLKKLISDLKLQLENYSKQNEYASVIEKIRRDPSLETIMEQKEFLMSLNPNIVGQYNIIEFFTQNMASDAPQVGHAIKTIIDMDEIKNYNSNISSSFNASLIGEEIERCSSILNGTNDNVDYLVSVLDRSGLSEEEVLDVLSKYCYDRVPKKEDKEEFEENKEEIEEELNEELKEEMVSIEKEIARLDSLTEDVEIIKKKYAYLLHGKKEDYINYALNLEKAMDFSKLSEENKKTYLNEILTCKYVAVMKKYETIEDIIKESVDGKLLETFAEILKEDITDLSVFITDFYNLTEQLKESEILKEVDEEGETLANFEGEKNKVLFLTDDSGKLVYDLADAGTKKDLQKLFRKCEKGNCERNLVSNGISVNLQSFSDSSCAYIKIDGTDYCILIDMSRRREGKNGKVDDICQKNEKLIREIRGLKPGELDELYKGQEGLRKKIEEDYGIKPEGDGMVL